MHDAEEFPSPPEFPAAPPVAPIPHQRAPYPGEALPPTAAYPSYGSGPAYGNPSYGSAPYGRPVEVGDLPPLVLVPGTAPLPLPPRRRRGRALLIGGAVTLVAALTVGAGVAYVINRDPLAERAAAAERPGKTLPQTPYEAANATLKAHAEALLRGDQKGWLAAVDPGRSRLRTKYRAMFASLRGLGVSHFVYKSYVKPVDKNGTLNVTVQVEYCFATDKCPERKYNQSDGPPRIGQELTFKSVKGTWLITAESTKKSREEQQPTPWETGDLVFAQGKRVTLIGTRSEQKYFKLVLPVAEKAAAVNDRFAGLVGNPQRRYRIYLAGPKTWKTWYGGITDKWVIGYAMPLGDSGSDVVLNIAQLRNSRQIMASTIQHELAHVVTLGGAYRTGGRGDMWLEEGIAEYIGWYPKPATASWRRAGVRSVVNSAKRPKSIATKGLAADAGPGASDAFYGLGHFAADCLARKYGQGALFTFVRLYLRENRDLDPASQEAFGRPFATVDKACVAWIRDRV